MILRSKISINASLAILHKYTGAESIGVQRWPRVNAPNWNWIVNSFEITWSSSQSILIAMLSMVRSTLLDLGTRSGLSGKICGFHISHYIRCFKSEIDCKKSSQSRKPKKSCLLDRWLTIWIRKYNQKTDIADRVWLRCQSDEIAKFLNCDHAEIKQIK